MTDLRNVPPVERQNPRVCGGFGESVETAGIEPAQGSPREAVPEGKRKWGSFKCAYCGRYQRTGGEYDHAPIPARHGGDQVHRVCLRCHDLKDRLPLDGWTEDEVLRAIRGTVELRDHLDVMEAFSAAFQARDPWKLPDAEAIEELAMTATCAEARIYILKGYAALLDLCGPDSKEAA